MVRIEQSQGKEREREDGCNNTPRIPGRLCEKCDGKCVICDSYVRPCTLVRICDECNYGSYQVTPSPVPRGEI